MTRSAVTFTPHTEAIDALLVSLFSWWRRFAWQSPDVLFVPQIARLASGVCCTARVQAPMATTGSLERQGMRLGKWELTLSRVCITP